MNKDKKIISEFRNIFKESGYIPDVQIKQSLLTLFLLFSFIPNLPAQITFSPSSLTWASCESYYDWNAVWNDGKKATISGFTTGSVTGMIEGVLNARNVNENPWALNSSEINPSQISVEYKSLGAKSTPFSARKVSDTFLKQHGINPHAVKYEYLGSGFEVAR